MLTPDFDNQICLLEAQFRDVSAALLDGDPVAMQSNSVTLQGLAVGLAHMVDQAGGRNQLNSSGHLRRINALSSGMVALRENLLRQSAYVERALEVLVPATRQKSTYAGGGVYGSPIRQSGEFTAFAA